jgi:alpha-L-rhamnosidase
MSKRAALGLSMIMILLVVNKVSTQIKVTQVYIENLINPLGLDERSPNFSWELSSDLTNTMQNGYEVKVAGNLIDLAKGKKLVWSEKKMNTDQSTYIAYKGPQLLSNSKYFWQVRVWDNKGRVSEWSAIANFHTGFFNKSDWKAKWINSALSSDTLNGVSPLLRKSFTLGNKVASATAFITSKGLYTAYLNGKKIGNDYLTPGWTSYSNRVQYQTYDVTNLLAVNDNVIGVKLGSGWFRTTLGWETNGNFYGKETALLLQINIKYTNGSEETIVSDGTWKSAEGPIRYSEIYNGEIYDARLEKNDWAKVGYNDQSWNTVKELEFGKEQIIATYNETIKKRESFKPKQIFTTPNGETVIDFGQNLVGWVKIKGKAKVGDVLQWKHFEVLDKKGNVYMNNMRNAKVNTTYIFKGNGEEEYHPNFTFYGFRYIWVEKGAALMDKISFEAEVLYSDMRLTGQFECSNPLINQLQQNIQWGQRGNFLDVPTDCPQRDERLGWTGDAQAFGRTAGYNFHVNNFFKKWLKDLAYDQLENGSVPFVIPNILGKGASGSAGWADAATIIPWDLYTMYGDIRVLQDQYPSMKKWVGFMQSKSVNNLWNTGFHFGDWLFFSRNNDTDGTSAVTDKYLIAQCFYAHSIQLLIKTAEVLGKPEDVKEYTALLAKIKKAFQDEYMTPNGRLIANTQTAYILALNFDMIPANQTAKAMEHLVDNIKRYNHLTTGFLGTPYLNHVLSKGGHDTLAYNLLLRKEYPSWLYPVTKGATTIWERWDGTQPNGDFQAESMNSFNHYAYGAIGDWMYQVITGIKPDEKHVGYKKFDIKPVIGGNLNFAKGSLYTYYGTIKSEWSFDDDALLLDVEVPVNTTARIHIPQEGKNIRINNMPLGNCSECKEVASQDPSRKVIEVGSGRYVIQVR